MDIDTNVAYNTLERRAITTSAARLRRSKAAATAKSLVNNRYNFSIAFYTSCIARCTLIYPYKDELKAMNKSFCLQLCKQSDV